MNIEENIRCSMNQDLKPSILLIENCLSTWIAARTIKMDKKWVEMHTMKGKTTWQAVKEVH